MLVGRWHTPACGDITILLSARVGLSLVAGEVMRWTRAADGTWSRSLAPGECVDSGERPECSASTWLQGDVAVPIPTGIALVSGAQLSFVDVRATPPHLSVPAGEAACTSAVSPDCVAVPWVSTPSGVAASGRLIAVASGAFAGPTLGLLVRDAGGAYRPAGDCLGHGAPPCPGSLDGLLPGAVAFAGGHLLVSGALPAGTGGCAGPAACSVIRAYAVSDAGIGPATGCAGTAVGCEPWTAGGAVRGFVASPDGVDVYVVTGAAITRLRPSPVDGSIAVGGCLSSTGADGCTPTGLATSTSFIDLTFSADGSAGLARASSPSYLPVLVNVTRDASTGELSVPTGAHACAGPVTGCVRLRHDIELDGPPDGHAVSIAPDGSRALVRGSMFPSVELNAAAPPACSPVLAVEGHRQTLVPCVDQNRDAFSLAVTAGPEHGTATASGRTLRYLAPPGFRGTDHVELAVSSPDDGPETTARIAVRVARTPSVTAGFLHGAERLGPHSRWWSSEWSATVRVGGAVRRHDGSDAPVAVAVAVGGARARTRARPRFGVSLSATRDGPLTVALPDYPATAPDTPWELLVYPRVRWDRYYQIVGGMARLPGTFGPSSALRKGRWSVERWDGRRWVAASQARIGLLSGAGRFAAMVPVPTAPTSYRAFWHAPDRVRLWGVYAGFTLNAPKRAPAGRPAKAPARGSASARRTTPAPLRRAPRAGGEAHARTAPVGGTDAGAPGRQPSP